MTEPDLPDFEPDDPGYDPKDHDQRTLGVTIHDYIDRDGDLLSLEVIDEEFLAVTVIRHGRDAALTAIFNDTDDARRFGAKMIEWADDIDEARR